MKYRVRSTKLSSGEESYSVCDSTGLPVRYGNLVLTERRLSFTASTLRRLAYDVVRVYEDFLQTYECRLDDAFYRGMSLDKCKLQLLGDTLLLDGEGQIATKSAVAGRFRAAELLVKEGFRVSTDELSKTVDRLRRVRRCSLYRAADSSFSHCRRDAPGFSNEELRLIAQACCPLPGTVSEGQISFPESNIFPPDLRLRNWLLVQSFRETGARRGELGSLRTEKVHGNAPRLAVARMHDDSTDPRRPRPASKTVERPIPISKSLLLGLQVLIRQNKRRHGTCSYVFISRLGRPMSLSAMDNVMQRLSKLSGVSFTSHDFRRAHVHKTYKHFLEKRGAVEDNDIVMMSRQYGWRCLKSADPYLKFAREEERLAFFRQRRQSLYSNGQET